MRRLGTKLVLALSCLGLTVLPLVYVGLRDTGPAGWSTPLDAENSVLTPLGCSALAAAVFLGLAFIVSLWSLAADYDPPQLTETESPPMFTWEHTVWTPDQPSPDKPQDVT